MFYVTLKGNNWQHSGQMSRIFKIDKRKTIETQTVKSAQSSLLLSDVIDADYQNSCLFKNKDHFSSPLCVLIGVPAKFHDKYFTNTCNWTLEIDFSH